MTPNGAKHANLSHQREQKVEELKRKTCSQQNMLVKEIARSSEGAFSEQQFYVFKQAIRYF